VLSCDAVVFPFPLSCELPAPMYGEFSLYGVFVPTLLGLMLLAYLLKSGLRLVLQRTGAYRHIWHPALFNLAVYVIVLGGLFSLMRWMQS
jgi:hypothetical protein